MASVGGIIINSMHIIIYMPGVKLPFKVKESKFKCEEVVPMGRDYHLW